MAYDCLIDLIGITKSECTCTINGLPGSISPADWYKKSTSDLFIDELEGIAPLQAAGMSTDCINEMANFYYRAKLNAIKQVADDIIIGLTQRVAIGQKSYTGKIASTTPGSVFNISGLNKAGLKLITTAMKGGSINISNITTMMDADATFNIEVYKQEYGTTTLQLITTLANIQSLAAGPKDNTVSLILPLSEYGCDYYFLYSATINPKQNSLSCGCGSSEYILRNYMQASGVAESSNVFTTYNNGMGLALYAIVGCDTTSIICEAFNNDDAAKLVMAYAARYKAGELVHEFISKSGNINRYTMVSQEAIWGKRNHFRSEYNTRINWLVENIDTSLIDCYVCNDNRVIKSGIMV